MKIKLKSRTKKGQTCFKVKLKSRRNKQTLGYFDLIHERKEEKAEGRQLMKELEQKREGRNMSLPPIVVGECPVCGRNARLNVYIRPHGCICGQCGVFNPDLQELLREMGWQPGRSE